MRASFGNQEVDVVEFCHQAEKAVQRLRSECSHNPVLGFDCEWNPKSSKVALLQLASQNYCYLFRLCYLGNLSPSLNALLGDKEVWKVGVGSERDAEYLWESYDINVEGSLDLRYVARKTSLPQSSLKEMANNFLNVRLKSYQRSWTWSTSDLTKEQIDYAAEDAIAGFELFNYFQQRGARRHDQTYLPLLDEHFHK